MGWRRTRPERPPREAASRDGGFSVRDRHFAIDTSYQSRDILRQQQTICRRIVRVVDIYRKGHDAATTRERTPPDARNGVGDSHGREAATAVKRPVADARHWVSTEGGGDSYCASCRARYGWVAVIAIVVVAPTANLRLAVRDDVGPFDAVDGLGGCVERWREDKCRDGGGEDAV